MNEDEILEFDEEIDDDEILEYDEEIIDFEDEMDDEELGYEEDNFDESLIDDIENDYSSLEEYTNYSDSENNSNYDNDNTSYNDINDSPSETLQYNDNDVSSGDNQNHENNDLTPNNELENNNQGSENSPQKNDKKEAELSTNKENGTINKNQSNLNNNSGNMPKGSNGSPKPNLSNSNSKDAEMLKQVLNKNKNQPRNNNSADDRSLKDKAKDTKEQIEDQAVKEAASAAIVAGTGGVIPKPLADEIASKIDVKKVKKQLKIKILLAILPSVMSFLLIIFAVTAVVSAPEKLIDSIFTTAKEVAYSVADFLFDPVVDLTEVTGKLVSAISCRDEEECNAAVSFYSNIKGKLDNANLTKGDTVSTVMAIVGYNRSQSDIYNASEEVDYLTNILASKGKYTIANFDTFKSSIIGEGGYLEKYRKHDLLANGDTPEIREAIYSKMKMDIEDGYKNYEEYIKNLRKKSTLCSAITVTGDNAGTYSLDDYVARVVSAENNWSYNGNVESIKASVVLARTQALIDSNNCTSSIDSPKMSSTPDELVTFAVNEVNYQVLVDEKGNYVSSTSDKFCYTSVDSENYTLCQAEIKIPVSWVNTNVNADEITELEVEIIDEEDDQYDDVIEAEYGDMSIWGSRYLSTIGYKYDQILSTFFPSTTLKTMTLLSSGLELTSTGFVKRTSRALRDNPYFYGDGVYNEGECAWYAVHRTNEILSSIGSEKIVRSGGNGRDFCYSSDYSSFPKIYNINEVKPGMVISWASSAEKDGHSFGHVAIIEDVHYDSAGNITGIDISEASNRSGTAYGSYYNGTQITNDVIWGMGNSEYKKTLRQYMCEGTLESGGNPLATGCQRFKTNLKPSQVEKLYNYQFICAIDLLR